MGFVSTMIEWDQNILLNKKVMVIFSKWFYKRGMYILRFYFSPKTKMTNTL